MSSSSPYLSIPQLTKLIQFNDSCEKYQNRLLELINRDKDISSEISVIIEALNYEQTLAGNLAGLMDIQWNGKEWSLGKTDFVKKLEPEIQKMIIEKLNSLHQKNFSEADLRIILQNILMLYIPFKTSRFIDQYRILCEIKQLLKACIETDTSDLQKSLLEKINDIIIANKQVLENLVLPSGINLFSRSKTFLSEAKEILNEAGLTIYHRAS